MFRRLSTDTLNWILIIGAVLLVLEIAFFNGGILLVSIAFALLMYVGWRNLDKTWGLLSFWTGAIALFIAIMNTMAVKFLIFAAIVLFIMDYQRGRKHPEFLEPNPKKVNLSKEKLLKISPLFNHRLFGPERTTEPVYEWRDVNLYSLYGHKKIDLTRTVLPNDTAIIAIRQLIGDIEIHVPYEVEVSIHHSSIFGRAHIFGDYHGRLMNQSLYYQTADYQNNGPRIKIITSLFSGDIEVKRT